nr:MAG TPA: hypothetical protein [Caudoviricetes sp.]
MSVVVAPPKPAKAPRISAAACKPPSTIPLLIEFAA